MLIEKEMLTHKENIKRKFKKLKALKNADIRDRIGGSFDVNELKEGRRELIPRKSKS